MPNIWSNKVYVQGFFCESILLKKFVKMFEQMEISESIYEGVVKKYYKKSTRTDARCAGHSINKKEEDTQLQKYYTMRGSVGKHRKRYVDCPAGESKICFIHGLGHSSDGCKVLGEFGTKYAKSESTKDHSNHLVPRNYFNRQQESNAIANNVVDDILLHETQKVSAAKEASEFLDYDCDENCLYQVERMSLEETKEILE